MRRIFLDTNFLMDYFIREEYHDMAEKLLLLARNKKYFLFVSYLSVANFAYIVRKLPSSTVGSMIYRMCTSLKVISNTQEQILKSLKLDAKDFEDGLQYQAAKDAKCDCIITRNQKDFSFSSLPVLSPEDFIANYW